MTTRENLVPDVVVDKNGKVTTVYRKPRVPQAKGATPLFPPVAVVTREERKLMIRDSISDLIDLDDERDIDALHKTLGQYSGKFLEELETALRDEDVNFATALAANVFTEENEEILRECITFARSLGLNDMGEAFSLVRSMRLQNRFSGYRDVSKAPEDMQRDYVALMGLTRLLSEHDKDASSPAMNYVEQSNSGLPPMPLIVDEGLVDLALESQQSMELMRNVIIDYNTADPNVIKGIMSGLTPTLAAGSL